MWEIGKWITDNILNVLGATNNTGGSASSGTAMAKLNALINTAGSISSNASSSYSALTNSTYGLSALNSKIGGGGVSVVKSVQRGTHAGSASNITISISTVNASKCSVMTYPSVTGAAGSASDIYSYTNPYVMSLTSSQLQVAPSTAPGTYSMKPAAAPFSWQVIEFY